MIIENLSEQVIKDKIFYDLQKIEKKSWNTQLEASLDNLKKRIKIHPRGYWVGKINEEIVSFIYFIKVFEKDILSKKGWDEITNNGLCNTHNEHGDCLFGVTLSSKIPNGGNLLMSKVLTEIDGGFYKNVKSIYACSRIPTLLKIKNKNFEKDPTVKLFKKHNFESVKFEKSGYKKDLDSQGYSLLMKRMIYE